MTTNKSSVSHSTPRDAYLHLLGTVTLFISVISLLTVIFQYINLLMPDPLNFYRQNVLEVIRGASSSLIVGFPIFIWLSSILYKDIVADPTKRELSIRKWLTYFTLLVAAVAMIIYLIVLVGGLYGGELSLAFALKVLSVFAIAGLVFGYYLWDVRQTGVPGLLPKQLAWASSIFVCAILIAGIFIAGTPAQQRRVRFDLQRTNDLVSIQSEIVQYWLSKTKLPTDIGQLNDSLRGYIVPTDPETKQKYEYKVLGTYKFELCTTYSAPDDNSSQSYPGSSTTIMKPQAIDSSTGMPIYSDLEGNWQHGIGRTCFERTIDPERYKLQTK